MSFFTGRHLQLIGLRLPFDLLIVRVHLQSARLRLVDWRCFATREQREGTNLCAFYVAESIMSRGQRTYSALSDSIGWIRSLKKINTKQSKKH
uniref:Uncharacterized protein n=1 Tax=Leersia perrieri TaxID=77586 RepID=A0A0D9X798_9ORYZ